MKKLIISTAVLAPALKKLSYAVNKNAVLPVLRNILVRATENNVTLIASDLEVTIHYQLICDCKEGFEVLVPFEYLTKIVAVNKNCPLTIESGTSLKIMGPDDIYEVKSPEKVEDFPKVQELPKKNSFSISFEILECLNTAVATIGHDNNRPKFSFVLLEAAPGKITVASTDGGYIVFSKEFVSEVEEAEELLLSAKIIKVLEGSMEAKVYYHKKAIGFETPEITIVNTRTEEKFVNFRKVFPENWPANLTISRDVLLEALGKCSISSDQLRLTKLSLSQSEVKLSTDDGVFSSNVVVPANYSGEVPLTQINSEKLIKLLNQVEYDEIEFAVHDKNRAIVLSAKDEARYKGMIMPIALNN